MRPSIDSPPRLGRRRSDGSFWPLALALLSAAAVFSPNVAGLRVSSALAQPGAQETQTLLEVEHHEPEGDPDIPERTLPNYDGREDAPPTAGDVLLWFVRIPLYPLYLVTEFLLRRPLSLIVTNVEENEIADKVIPFFTFGPSNNIAIAPTFSFDFGFRPNVGLYFRYNDFLAKNNHLRAGFSFGGRAWQTGSLAYRYAPNEQWQIQLSGSATRRPDGRFFGIGSQANEDLESEYGYLGASGALTTQGNFWRQSNLRIGVGYRRTEFHSDVGSDVDDISIEDRFEAGQFDALPPGYSDGISVLYQSAKLTIDTRRARPAPGSGLRVTAGYELAFDARHPGEQLWINYGRSTPHPPPLPRPRAPPRAAPARRHARLHRPPRPPPPLPRGRAAGEVDAAPTPVPGTPPPPRPLAPGGVQPLLQRREPLALPRFLFISTFKSRAYTAQSRVRAKRGRTPQAACASASVHLPPQMWNLWNLWRL